MAAGLRIRDGNLYEPDPSLIPRDVRGVHREARLLWREQRALARAVASWARDEGHPELRFTAETGELNGWSDPLPLARLAVALRPNDFSARVGLFAALFRWRGVEEAADQLSVAASSAAVLPFHLRLSFLRASALVLESRGDVEGAARAALTGLEARPFLPGYRRDYLAYSIATGMEASLVRAIRELRKRFGPRDASLAFAAVCKRGSAPANRLLRRRRDLLALACAELRLQSSESACLSHAL